MQLVEVVPIIGYAPGGELSYFTSKKIKAGSVIVVPLKKNNILGIVVSSQKISESKARLRGERFMVRKIQDPTPKFFLPNDIFFCAKELANISISTLGSVLNSLFPQSFFDVFEDLLKKDFLYSGGDIHETYVLQSTEEERFAHYRSILREQIAKKQSVIFLCPTSVLAESSFKKLTKGIEDYCFLLTSLLTEKKKKNTLMEIMSSTRPIVVVTTGKFLTIPRKDIGAIILEKENSNFYKKWKRPYIDMRLFAEIFAKKIKAKLYLGDLYLRTETLWRAQNGEIAEFIPVKSKLDFKNSFSLVDLKSKGKTPSKYKIVGKELEGLIREAVDSKEKIFLYSARKGLHPITVCGDCGEVVLCKRCSSPVVLHNAPNGNFFLCHKCGRARPAEERCEKCNSWKLVPLGMGIELLEKRLKENFKEAKIFRIDGDVTGTSAKAKKVFDAFTKEEGGILIGTEMAISYLEEVPYSAVVSIDSFFSIPDFRMNEKILNLLLSIREKTSKKFNLQTRDSDQTILPFIENGFVMDFYRNEIEQRKEFGFPPFSLFIKITFSGTADFIKTEEEKLGDYLKNYDVSFYSSFVSRIRGKMVRNALIKIKSGSVDLKLREKILSLPPNFSVDVNPDNLL